MGKPYSMDLRQRVVAAVVSGGLSCNRAAKRFGVGISTAINWVQRVRETGSVAPGKMGVTSRKRLQANTACGCLGGSRMETSPCAGWWPNSPGAGSRSIIARSGSSSMLRSSASKKSLVAGERDRPDVARRRAQWTKYQDRIEPQRLVFIDETWTNIRPTWRRCADGRRAANAYCLI